MICLPSGDQTGRRPARAPSRRIDPLRSRHHRASAGSTTTGRIRSGGGEGPQTVPPKQKPACAHPEIHGTRPGASSRTFVTSPLSGSTGDGREDRHAGAVGPQARHRVDPPGRSVSGASSGGSRGRLPAGAGFAGIGRSTDPVPELGELDRLAPLHDVGHALEVIEDQVAVAEAQAAFIELMGAEGPIHRALLHLRIILGKRFLRRASR